MKLGELFEISKGKKPGTLTDKQKDGYIRFIQIEDLRDSSNLKYCDPSEGCTTCTENDILIVWDGAYSGLVAHGLKGALGSTIAKLSPRNASVFPPFVARFLQSQFAEIQRNRTGATIPHVSGVHLRNIQIPLPPLAEQKRIAAILDAADALRAKRREAIAQLDTLLQSTFLEMFGDPVTNPKGWETVPLEALGTLDRGISKHRPRNDPKLLGGEYPLIQTGDVAQSNGYIAKFTSSYSELGLKQSKVWPAGTLCITIAANIAKTGILTFDSCFPDSVVGFTSCVPGRVEYVQALFWFFQKLLDQQASQVAQKNINLKILRNLAVPKPPAQLESSYHFLTKAVEKQKTLHRQYLANLDHLFLSIQHQVFNM